MQYARFPGDVVSTGTSGSPAKLADGDAVEVEIDGIGVLRSPVRRGSLRYGAAA